MPQPYRDEPQQSQADLHEYYDTPDAHSSIPMVEKKYGGYNQPLAADSQADMVGDRNYSSAIAQNNAWLEKSATKSSGRPKWMILGAVGLLALIGAGVAIAVVLIKKNQDSSSSSSSSSASSSSSNSSSDPSIFTKNPALVQSFYGIAYTPEGSQYPACGNSLDDVITDIQLLSQLTTRIRLYGADCNQTELVLEAIKQTKVNMTVWIANYVDVGDNGTAYDRQRDELEAAIQKYGVGNIGGMTVGNEFILDYLADYATDTTDPNSSVANTGAAILIADIDNTRTMMSNLSLSNITIGTSDAGAYFNTLVLEAIDYGMANVHPWFADTTIEDAAAWTAEFFEDTDIAVAANVSNKPQMYIAETGWPTNSSTTAAATNGAAVASEANLQIFLDDFVCQANANGTKYFFFEYFDEEWKNIEYGGVEGYWGLFYANRTLKGITIPTCDS
ncbi:glycoside hydrolase family 17 protein [Mycena maculata]|uniref:glucan endo-1,3-beta-D-glucosidase n=1 Tax=Mycena maculata TaxID=230809 RepID=A0AAD7NIC3_9AGAR|nr:glycoside hydrolase family 17 protein [Mycena maculata]